MKYHIITFGCQMNKSDSERIAATLKDIGYKSASSILEADLVMFNMCSVRQSAVDRIHGRIRELRKLKKKNPNFKTLLTGCILRHDFKKLEKEFDYILSIKTLPYWKQALRKQRFSYYPGPRDPDFNQRFSANYLKEQALYQNDFSDKQLKS